MPRSERVAAQHDDSSLLIRAPHVLERLDGDVIRVDPILENDSTFDVADTIPCRGPFRVSWISDTSFAKLRSPDSACLFAVFSSPSSTAT